MKQTIKNLLKSGINGMVDAAGKSALGRYSVDQALSRAMERTWSIKHRGIELSFAVPNSLNHFRVDTFATKEPETLEWIDSIPQGAVLWDIGANVGLYTCYAAKARHCRVFAFEPSVFNLELLARNIFLNQITDQVTIVPLPLTDVLAVSTFNMTTTEWGGALSSFGQTYGYDGQSLNKMFEFRTIGISMVDAVEFLKIQRPDFLKIDVDGIEHLILIGGAEILADVKGVLIEINDDFERQSAESARLLLQAGLVLKDKRHADIFEQSPFSNCYNQTWQRPGASRSETIATKSET